MPKRTTNKTRKNYLVEQVFEPLNESLLESDDVTEGMLDDPKDRAESYLQTEDERIWAYHRDPRVNLTQMEARDRGQSMDYPERYNLSQSSVSRKLSKLDDDMLTEPISLLPMGERETDDPDVVVGFLAPGTVDSYKKHGFDQLLDEYRAVLARFIVDLEALSEFSDGENVTPQWARDLFGDLDPDLGRRYYKRAGFVSDESLHPPASETEGVEVPGVPGD